MDGTRVELDRVARGDDVRLEVRPIKWPGPTPCVCRPYGISRMSPFGFIAQHLCENPVQTHLCLFVEGVW